MFAIIKEYNLKIVGEVLFSLKVYKWCEAMDTEISQLLQRGIFKFILTLNKRVLLTAKWVFKKKRNFKNQAFGYKVKLVTKGFLQI